MVKAMRWTSLSCRSKRPRRSTRMLGLREEANKFFCCYTLQDWLVDVGHCSVQHEINLSTNDGVAANYGETPIFERVPTLGKILISNIRFLPPRN